jgi:glucans biosynthesis protein C
MKTTKTESFNRVIFLDNLRYFFVLCVVLFHSGTSYISVFFTKWWPVMESNSSIIVTSLNSIFDVFIMPLLFYIAGYFALPAIQKHGISFFIKGKLKRLGIPWIVCILTICPILPLIYHYTRDNLTLTTSYLDLWIILMKNAAQFNVGIIASMDKLMMNNEFYQRYMWFISLLLLFFAAFSIIYKVKKKWFDQSCSFTAEKPSVLSTLKLLVKVGLLSFICSLFLVSIMFIFGYTNPTTWFTLGNLIQFQVIRLASFIIYFGMGVITYKNKWIERGKFPGHLKTWMISFFVLLISYTYLMNVFMNSPVKSKAMYIYGFMSLPVYCFFTIAVLGFFSSLAIKYWNHPRKLDQNLASNSYNIYLSHYIFVLIFQLILFTIPGIPVLLKFVIVSAASIICAYIVSKFLIKPFPKATVALLFIMLIVMFAVIKP